MTKRNAIEPSTESYTKRKRLAAYKAANGGRDPPDPPLLSALKTIAPCLFRAQRERERNPLHLKSVRLATGEEQGEGEEAARKMKIKVRREIQRDQGEGKEQQL